MAHQANPEENFNDKFQWNKSKVKTFTKTVPCNQMYYLLNRPPPVIICNHMVTLYPKVIT